MGSLGPPSPTPRPRAATGDTPGFYVSMAPINSSKVSVCIISGLIKIVKSFFSPTHNNYILQPTPPKKPPRRNLSVSPTHLQSNSLMSTSMDSGSNELNKNLSRFGEYEYLFLAKSGVKSHSDLEGR